MLNEEMVSASFLHLSLHNESIKLHYCEGKFSVCQLISRAATSVFISLLQSSGHLVQCEPGSGPDAEGLQTQTWTHKNPCENLLFLGKM